MFTLLLFYLGGGLVAILIAVPLLLQKVKPNPFYGFRLKATLEDPAAWYAVNKYFAKQMLAASMLHVLAAIGFYLIPGMTVDLYALAVLAVVVAGFGVAFAKSMRYLKSL